MRKPLTTRAFSTAIAALAATATVLGVASPAHADVRGRIVSVQASNGVLRIVFSAAGLGANDSIDPSSVKLTVNGQPLQAQVTRATEAQTASVTKRVVLAFDTSGSMFGARIAAAKQAAGAYLNTIAKDVSVGLVTFSNTPALLVAPTTDRGPLRAAVAGLTAHDNTALYDAISLALTQLGSTGDRSILVLSDGKDEGSHTTLAHDVDALRRAKVPLDAVVIGGDPAAQQALRTLSAAAGGRVVPARAAADLTAQFVQAAQEASKDVILTATIPSTFTGGQASVTVTGTAGGTQVSDTAIALNLESKSVAAHDPAAFGPKAVKPLHGLFRHKTALLIGLIGLFVGLGGLLAFALNGVAARPQTMRGRINPYVDTSGMRVPEPEQRSVRQTALGLADDIVKQQGLEELLAKKLDAGGVPLKPSEWLMVHIGFALVLPLMVILLTNVNPALTILSVLVGILGPLGYLTVKATFRTRAFLAQLPDTLQLLSGSLSAGYSLPQALDAVVRQGTPPIADELKKALIEARLGAPVEDALDDVADRMDSKDFRWVVMAIRIQRQVGGNLAEVLSTTAATLRERERLRRQVQVLSAEGRLSAYILFGLPIVFALYMLVARPGYIKPMFTDPLGIVMLVGMGILLTVGGFWLKRVVEVEV